MCLTCGYFEDGVEVQLDDRVKQIDEGVVHVLVIKNVQDSDAGRYQCKLVKSGNTTSCNVMVEDSPFQCDPMHKSIFVGESAEFEVMVKDAASKVLWSVNGKSDDSRYEPLAASGFTRKFKVNSANLEDAGQITCVVEGRETKPVQCQFNVYEHLVVTKPPQNWSGKEKEECTITIETNKEASVTWYSNRKALSPDDQKYTYASQGCIHTLSFKCDKEDDGANIEATFGAELDEYVSASCNLELACGISPPKIDAVSSDQDIVLGQADQITFELRGKPDPAVTAMNREQNKEYAVVQCSDIKVQRLIKIDCVSQEDGGTYVINAKNDEGSDSAVINVTVVNLPSAPDGITVTKMTNDACGFCWRAPSDTGNLNILSYQIGWRYAEEEEFKEIRNKDDTTSYFLQDLKEGSSIELKVAAINRAGTGEWSGTVGPHVVSDGIFPPGYPTDVTVDAENVTSQAVPIKWDSPLSDGGSPVTGYEVEKQLDGMDMWETAGSCEGTNYTVASPAVKDGKAYRFRVKAVNKAGASGGSEPTDLVHVEDPNTKPASPDTVTADNPSNDSIDVSWKVPKSPLEITGYRLERLKAGDSEWIKSGEAAGDQVAITVTELEPDTPYCFRVFASNADGESRASEMSNLCKTMLGEAPDVEPQLIVDQSKYRVERGQPFMVKVKVLGRPQCEVEWTKNGEAWWEYARYGGGYAQISIPAAQGSDSGDYQITAKNRAGESVKVIAIEVTGMPSEPRELAATGMNLTWIKPATNGGEPIDGYLVECKNSDDEDSSWTEAGNPVDCEHVCEGLAPGGNFLFRVAAYNKLGQGPFATLDGCVSTPGGKLYFFSCNQKAEIIPSIIAPTPPPKIKGKDVKCFKTFLMLIFEAC